MWDAEEGIERAFADLEELADECRFNDCRHAGEPGCAVAAAVDDGLVTAERVASWHKLQREVRWLETRKDQRARAEERALWKKRIREANPTRRR